MKDFPEREIEREREGERFVSLWNDECDARSHGNHIITRRGNPGESQRHRFKVLPLLNC